MTRKLLLPLLITGLGLGLLVVVSSQVTEAADTAISPAPTSVTNEHRVTNEHEDLLFRFYLPLVWKTEIELCPAPEPLPAVCYTTNDVTARDQCVLSLGQPYVLTLSYGSDVYLGFPITATIQARVNEYPQAADVDLVFWGENQWGQNVQGPFHPVPTGGPLTATWTPESPYVTPGIYLVEIFSMTGFTFTAQLTVENVP